MTVSPAGTSISSTSTIVIMSSIIDEPVVPMSSMESELCMSSEAMSSFMSSAMSSFMELPVMPSAIVSSVALTVLWIWASPATDDDTVTPTRPSSSSVWLTRVA